MSSSEKYKNNPLYGDITRLDHLSPQPTFTYSWNIETSTWEPNTSEPQVLKVSPSYKTLTKTVEQKIEEDFFLLENITDELRYGVYSGECFGEDKFIMDDIFNVHFENARTNPSTPETGHPDYFIHTEHTDTGRCIESNGVFHSDTSYGLRAENKDSSTINSYQLKDFSNLYESGVAESVILFNESPYPIQFHTANKTTNGDLKYGSILYLYPDGAVQINTDEASNVFIKRPHTISGYTVKYAINYRETESL